MNTVQDFLCASFQERIELFIHYLINDEPKRKLLRTAKSYAKRYAKDDVVRGAVKALTGKCELYEVVNVLDIQDIYDKVKATPKEGSKTESLSAVVAAYKRFIEHLLVNSSSITQIVLRPTYSKALVKKQPSLKSSGDPSYRSSSGFINSSILTNLENELMKLIINFNLPLVDKTISFADILDRITVEFSNERKTRVYHLEASCMRKKIDELKEEAAKIEREIAIYESQKGNLEENPSVEYERIFFIKEFLLYVAACFENYLEESNGSDVKREVNILGEFIPGSTPKVVLYYKNMTTYLHYRWKEMVGVFVHEMFHAWNYFQTGERARSVLAVDEPMVEFETLFFLDELEHHMNTHSYPLMSEVSKLREHTENFVEGKKEDIGDITAYAFGYYLYKNVLGLSALEWIEVYSAKSSIIGKGQPDVMCIEESLIPVYPVNDERIVMDWFKLAIFYSII